MSALSSTPFAVPAKWVVDIMNINENEVINYVSSTPDLVAYISMDLEYSKDVNHVLSAIISVHHLMNKNHEAKPFLIKMIGDLTNERLLNLMSMRPDLMRECVRLFKIRESPPSRELLHSAAKYIMKDSTSVELLVDIWVQFKWKVTTELTYIAQYSCGPWEFLQIPGRSPFNSSRQVIEQIVNQDEDRWPMIKLIGVNGSALEYLIHLDTYFSNGVGDTIDTINGYELWDFVLCNPAASPLIDFVFLNPYYVNFGKFPSTALLREWIIPRIGTSLLAGRYTTINDLDSNTVSASFFSNPAAIDLLMDWLYEDNVTPDILHGLVTIASSDDESAACKALDIIDAGYNSDGIGLAKLISFTRWMMLLRSPYGKDYAVYSMYFSDIHHSVSDIIRASNLVPYWECVSEHKVGLFNLTLDIIQTWI